MKRRTVSQSWKTSMDNLCTTLIIKDNWTRKGRKGICMTPPPMKRSSRHRWLGSARINAGLLRKHLWLTASWSHLPLNKSTRGGLHCLILRIKICLTHKETITTAVIITTWACSSSSNKMWSLGESLIDPQWHKMRAVCSGKIPLEWDLKKWRDWGKK